MRSAMITLAAAICVSGCVAYGPYGAGPGPGPVGYDAYYDGYYGPILGGYWGPGGAFYYQRGDHRWIRDSGAHFRRGAVRGYHAVHFAAQPHR